MNGQDLALRLQELLLDGKWIANTNFKEILHDISRQEAQCKIDGLNTIEALVFHVSYYLDGILEAFEKEELQIKDAYCFDFQPAETDEIWLERVRQFELSSIRFVEVIKTFTQTELNSRFFKEEYGSLQRNLEAQIEHGYYHLGQISLLLKLIRKKSQ